MVIVVVLATAPAKIRGHLTRWLFEISPGVYVGKASARVRELLWEQILDNIGDGRAVMVYAADNEQGLEFKTYGQEWSPVDFDGLELIMRPDDGDARKPRNSYRRTGWSNASRYRRFGR